MSTWNEFKEEIEKQLKEKEIPDNAEILWIDCGYMLHNTKHVSVNFDREKITIS